MSETAPASDHFLGLTGAAYMSTSATLTTHRLLETAITTPAMICIHGEVGLGKTLAVRTNLRDLAKEHSVDVLDLEFRRGAGVPALCEALFHALKLPGEPPSRPAPYDQLLRKALSLRPYLLVCDEAQGLSVNAMEYLRQISDDRYTQVGIVFVGGENAKQRIDSRPALSSRMAAWQQFHPLTIEEVEKTIPNYHRLWSSVSLPDLHWIDDLVCHGNFRNWAKTTFHLQQVLALPNTPDTVSRDLVRTVLADLDTTYRA